MEKWIFSLVMLITVPGYAGESLNYINKYTELCRTAVGYTPPDERFITPVVEPKIRFCCPISDRSGLFYYFTPDIALSTQPVNYEKSHIDDSLRFGMLISVSMALY